MGFSNITINNFRGIAYLEVNDLKRINLFGGANNSGKTTVLESVFVLSGPSNPFLAIRTNSLRELLQKPTEEHLIILFHQLNIQKNIHLEAIEQEGHKRNLIITPIYKNELIKQVDFEEENKNINGLKHQLSGSFVTNSTITMNEDGWLVEEQVKSEERIDCIFLNSYSLMKTIDERINKIIINRNKNRLIEVLQQLDNRIIDVHTSNDVVYLDIGLDRFVPINVMGDGMKRLLAIVSAIYNFKDGIVLIDEIDNGLYRTTQKMLWKAVILAAQTFNVQIYATTHSWECLEALNVAAKESVANGVIPEDEIRYFRIEKTEDKHTAFAYRQTIFETAIEEKWEVR
ncbi:MAG: AAA family ATPase [Sphingobacteriales bacterium]|nr:AAA family ATPase [Sphingobacteriales bacterium]